MDRLMGAVADFLMLYGGWGIVAVLIILFLFFGDRMLSTVERFWSVSRGVSTFTFKRYTSTKLSNQILHATKFMSGINPDILPYRIKIKWVKSENIESFLKSGQVIIKIRDDQDINKSFVLAVAEFVRQGLIHNVKRHLRDQPLIQAIDLCAVDKILSQAYIESLSYFEKNMLDKMLGENPEISKRFQELKQIDCSGLFLPVFLNEMSKALNSISGQYFIDDYENEVKSFLAFLIEFCKNKHKKLFYKGKYIQISFGLIANKSFISRHGRNAYVEKVRSSLSSGIQTVYLFGWGNRIKTVKQVAERAARADMRIKHVKTHLYHHVFEDRSTARAICTELRAFDKKNDDGV